jgi:hypothetical protein
MHVQRNAPVSGHVYLKRASAARSGTRSTGSPTAARCRSDSGRSGQARGSRPPATSPRRPQRRSSTRSSPTPAAAPSLARPHRRDVQGRLRRMAPLRRTRPAGKALDGRVLQVRRPRHLDPAFGGTPIEHVTTRRVEDWRAPLLKNGKPSARSLEQLVTNLYGIFERARRVWGLTTNPVVDVERLPKRYSGDLDFYSPEEVLALVRAADTEQDGAIYLAAAFTGLRKSPRRLPSSVSATTSPATATSSSPSPANTSTAPPAAAATSARSRQRSSVRSGSTTYGTRSGRSRSTAPRSCRCRSGSATPTSTQPAATCTTSAARTRRNSSPGRSWSST